MWILSEKKTDPDPETDPDHPIPDLVWQILDPDRQILDLDQRILDP